MNNKDLIARLSEFVTPERVEILNRVLDKRTRYMTLVLEDIYHSHNASAVMRTCECFGIQDLHVIENLNKFEIHPNIVRGASKWLTISHYNERVHNSEEAVKDLKSRGYRIVSTTPHEGGVDLFDFDVEKGPFAIVIGSEKTGVSKEMMALSDEYLTIPMVGFTESLNLSVSAALVMSHLHRAMEHKQMNIGLSDDEKELLLIQWLMKSIRSADEVLARILESENV